MFKRIFVGGSLCAGLWLLALPAQAQTPTSPAPTQPQPTTPEASPAPANPAATNTEVSDSEIEKFANAIKQFQTIQQDAQEQATSILDGEQLSWERFNQILQTQRNPEAQSTTEISSEEQQSFDRAVSKLGELQQSTRTRMDQALAAEDLERERFVQILAMVRQDATLRQRIEEELKN